MNSTAAAETAAPPTPDGRQRYDLLKCAVAAILVPLAVYAVLAPDWYYVQNGLDPFFYTGYVQNFDNIFHAIGDRHYFVSRWSIYMPQRLLLELTGNPKAAYLLMRWIGGVILAASIVALGQRRWRRWDTVALAALALAMPVTLRAVLTDYSDAVVTPLGALVIASLALWPRSRRAALAAGVCAGLIVVANPFGITVVMAAVPFWLARVERRRWLSLVATSAFGGIAVLVAGWALFRFRYGLPNVYEPTLEFLRTRAAEQDPLKSPRLWWMGYRLWIYLPLLVLAVYVGLQRWGRVVFDPVERTIVKTLLAQYCFQVWFQFSRHGSTLEIPYYWSYIVPSFVLAISVVGAAAFRSAAPRTLPLVAALVLVGLRLAGAPSPELFQSWIDAVIVVVVAVWASQRWLRSRPELAAVAFVAVVFAIQVGSPRPEPQLPEELRVLSSYDLLFSDARSDGIESFEAVTWFVRDMEQVPERVVRSAVFWFNEPIGARMTAMFGGQVSGRWLNPNWESNVPTDPLPSGVIGVLQSGELPTVVLIGVPADVEAIADQMIAAQPRMRLIHSATSPARSGTVVWVLTTIEE
jgi:4-amino-4-deoxy-L-arabinose transferase-like glycosyltransferase